MVTCAYELGFTSIAARGFDIAQAQIKRARLLARNLSNLPGVKLTFEVADLNDPLPEADASVDITLCLYSVLSHLPVASLAQVTAEFARVTSGRVGRSVFCFHLFTATELRSCFADRFDVEDLRGLDVFHSRFMPDPRWNPVRSGADRQLADELVLLEEAYAAHPAMIDRASHLLLVARSRQATQAHNRHGM
jgi:SAM-dependent methyltransferase